jgi:amino-acid N-acetyltransferase
MTAQLLYRLATENDLAPVAALLEKYNLPASDLHSSKIDFILAVTEEDEVIGCIGVEQYQSNGLLRSFAVEKAYRNQQIGKTLFDKLISLSVQNGITIMHLLTTTAEEYFGAQGFVLADRNAAPDSIKATAEFSSLCPSSSIYMNKRIVPFK